MERITPSPSIERPPLSPEKVHELLYGEDAYCLPTHYRGYGDPVSRDPDMTHFISEEMRRDWLANRTKLMMLWNGEAEQKELFGHYPQPWLIAFRGDKEELPWAARMLDRGDKASASIDE